MQQGQKNDGGDGMFVDGGGAASANGKLANQSKMARAVYDYISNTPGGSEGLNLYDIASAMGIAPEDCRREAENLMDAGVLYTTVDDDTWAMLEV